MRLLFLGDIVGRSGRRVVTQHLPDLRRRLRLDFVVANGENAAGGFGITRKVCNELFGAGVDVITGGNHSWDQREALDFIDEEERLLRPINYPAGTPGRGVGLYATPSGEHVLVVNVMGQLFMESLDDPFRSLEQALSAGPLGDTIAAVVVDVHAEATSEKMAVGHFVDGRVSLCVGTHTHVPTADTMILPGGTAYQSDAGMCGDYDSIIGLDKDISLGRFLRKVRTERLAPAVGEGTLCGIYVETEPRSGLAQRVEPVRIGAHLLESLPRLEADAGAAD